MHLEDGEEMSIRKYFFSESADESIAGSERGWVLYSDYEQLERTAKMLAEALHACHLQMLQSNNDSEYAEEANQLAITAQAAARKDGLL
jgi:phage tail sheath protein FI